MKTTVATATSRPPTVRAPTSPLQAGNVAAARRRRPVKNRPQELAFAPCKKKGTPPPLPVFPTATARSLIAPHQAPHEELDAIEGALATRSE